MNRLLEPGELYCFDIAQYKCTAQRMPEPREDDVYVVVSLNGEHVGEFICDAELTVVAIRILTARRIFEETIDA